MQDTVELSRYAGKMRGDPTANEQGDQAKYRLPDAGAQPECEPSLWLHAFYNFAATGSITEPFVVTEENARPRDAWPFQFRPQNLIRCEGFAAVVAET